MSGLPRPWVNSMRRENRLQQTVAKLQHVAATALVGGLMAFGLTAQLSGLIGPRAAGQLVLILLSAAGSLGGLALVGRMWLTWSDDKSAAVLAALGATGLLVMFMGGGVSYLWILPVPLAVIGGPFCPGRSGWLVAIVASAILALPLAYGFSVIQLALTALGWAVIFAGKRVIDHLVVEVAAARSETRELRAVAQASSLATTLDVDSTMQGIVDAIRELLLPHACVVYTLDRGSGELSASHTYFDPQVYRPDHESAVRRTTVKLGEGLVGSVAAEGQPLLLRSVLSDPRAIPIPGTVQKDRTYMILPLRAGNETFGVLRVSRDEIDQYNEDDLTLASIFANQAAAAIANAHLFERVKASEELARLSESRYERLTRHAGEAILTYSFEEQRVVHANAAMEQLLGYTLDELQTEACDLFGLVHPDSVEGLERPRRPWSWGRTTTATCG